MKPTAVRFFAAALLQTGAGDLLASVHYVDVSGTNSTPPYSNWRTAATNIQDAVDAAVEGDEIVVTNGTYSTGGRNYNLVEVEKAVSLCSVNGPQATLISAAERGFLSTYMRCVYLTNGASLSGFTLSDGQADYGGGAYGGTLNNCTLRRNVAAYGGGACNCTLNNCTVDGNSADGHLVTITGGFGIGSSTAVWGGGACGCTLNNCTLTGNSAIGYSYTFGDWFPCGEGIGIDSGYCYYTFTVDVQAYGGGASGCILNNCTLSRNTTYSDSAGAYGCTLNNCIALDGASSSALNNCWTTVPLFVDEAAGNLRLQSNSPCINAGNNAYVSAGTDLDGNPRIKGGTVDIGAYEFQSPTSIISYAWLQQYGLLTDGSADFADTDGDGMNNWQEWRCGTDPTNALSALRLLAPVNTGTNVNVLWQSIGGVNYFLERSTDLEAASPFTAVATNLVGQPGTTTYTDTTAVASGPCFYRVGVGN